MIILPHIFIFLVAIGSFLRRIFYNPGCGNIHKFYSERLPVSLTSR